MTTNRPTTDRGLWAVLHYLRTLHELLDWAPRGLVPRRQLMLWSRRESFYVRRMRDVAQENAVARPKPN